jgi:redox-sensitive bicupin YhaK (pirin superfamily)
MHRRTVNFVGFFPDRYVFGSSYFNLTNFE